MSIFLNFENNFKYSVFITFRLRYFYIFCQNLSNFKMGRWGFNYIFKLFLEYFDSFIIFTYRIYLTIWDTYNNSPLLKQVWIIFLTTVILWGTLVIINIYFFKKGIKTSNIINYAKLRINTLLLQFLNVSSFVYFFLLLLCKANNKD